MKVFCFILDFLNFFILDIIDVDIPNSFPLVCEFDEDMNLISRYYLGNETEINQKIKNVKNEGKSKK